MDKKTIRWIFIVIWVIAVLTPFNPVAQAGWFLPFYFLILAIVNVFFVWKWIQLDLSQEKQN